MASEPGEDISEVLAEPNYKNFTCIFPSKNYESTRGKEYIAELIAEKEDRKVILCILDKDLDLSDELKEFKNSRKECVVNFTNVVVNVTNEEGESTSEIASISEVARTEFIRVIAKILDIAIHVPRSMADLDKILDDEPDLTEEEVTGKKSKIVVYMEKFMKEGNEDDKQKLDRHATLVLSKALLNDDRYKELKSWLRDEPPPSEEDPENEYRWGCSVVLSDLIINHDSELAGLAMTVYTKSKLPKKKKMKEQKTVNIVRRRGRGRDRDLMHLLEEQHLREREEGTRFPRERAGEGVDVRPVGVDVRPVRVDERSVRVDERSVRVDVRSSSLSQHNGDPDETDGRVDVRPADEGVDEGVDERAGEESVAATDIASHPELAKVNKADIEQGLAGSSVEVSSVVGESVGKSSSLSQHNGDPDETDGRVGERPADEGMVERAEEESPAAADKCGCCDKICKCYDWVTETNHKCSLLRMKKRGTLSFKAFMFLFDLITDMIFTVEMFLDGQNALGILSVLFIIVPLAVGNSLLSEEVSFQLTTKHEFLKNKWLLKALNILQLKPMVYCLALLTHAQGRMWVIAKNFYDYTRIRYLERMTENVPETILQVYVISKELFHLKYLQRAKWQGLSWSNVNRGFSLTLSLILFPKAIVDKECWERKSDMKKFDFSLKQTVCLCDKNYKSDCCGSKVECKKCRFCRIFTKLEIPVQTPLNYLMYLIMIIARLMFYAIFFMAFNSPETKFGKYNTIPIIITVTIACLKFMYYWNVGEREYTFGIRYHLKNGLKKVFPSRDFLSKIEKPEDSAWVNFKLCFVKTYTQAFIPNNGTVDRNWVALFKCLLVPHFFVMFEMCALNLFINFYLEDKLLGVYTDEIVKYISIISIGNTLLYCLAVVGYCTSWYVLHPDKFREKSKWKELQDEKFKEVQDKKEDLDYKFESWGPNFSKKSIKKKSKQKDVQDKVEDEGEEKKEEKKNKLGYEFESWGCGVLIDCDYKSKSEKFNAAKAARKEELKDIKKKCWCKGMLFKALYWCYDPHYDYTTGGGGEFGLDL